MFEEIGILHEIGMVNNKDGKHLHAVVSSRLSGNDICVVGVYTSGFKTTTSGKNISETQTAITGCRVQYLTWAQISTCSFLCTFGVFVFLNYSLPESSQIPSLEFWHLLYIRVRASVSSKFALPRSLQWHCCVWPHTALLLFRHKNIRPSGWTFLLNRKQRESVLVCAICIYLQGITGIAAPYMLSHLRTFHGNPTLLCLNFLETCSNKTHGSMGIKFIIWMTSSCNVSNRFYMVLPVPTILSVTEFALQSHRLKTGRKRSHSCNM